MLLSLRLTPSVQIKQEVKDEPEDEGADKGIAELRLEEFDECAGCKAPFKNKKPEAPEEMTEEEQEKRRGQLPPTEVQGVGRKVKEFYSFNTVSGELLHVTALQALLQVFELRLVKSAPGVNLFDANDKLGFCQNCGTLISQLYKLHQEVADLVKDGSLLSKMLEYEETLTDNCETDPTVLKKRKLRAASKVNGVSLMEEMDQDGSSWSASASADGGGSSVWDNDDDMSHDDTYSPMDNEDEDLDSPKSRHAPRPRSRTPKESRSVGIKITSVGSAKTLVCEDLSSGEGEEGGRRRRSTARKVDYRKILDGPKIEGVDEDMDDTSNGLDTEYVYERESPNKFAKKRTGPTPPSGGQKKRGRPPKNAKVVVPPPKQRERDPHFKSPADKTSKEAPCQICRKVFPSSYLAEHMNVAHNAIQGQPCLICGKFFESSYKAIKHLLTHVPEKAFGCSRCHDTFKTAEERDSHTNAHTEEEKRLQCIKCSQTFTSLLHMNKHEAQKHRTTKSFLCSICAKLLTGKDEWIQHILSHGPFQCYYCREFLQPGEYKRHVQTVHMQGGNRPRPGPTGPPTVLAEVTIDDD